MKEEKEHDASTQKEGIAKIEGRPIPNQDGSYSWLDKLLNKPFFKWLRETLKDSEKIAREYAQGKASQETATVKKIVEEAGEIAARKEKTFAEVEKVLSDTESTKQDAIFKMISNLEKINSLPSHLQPIALAELFSRRPDLIEQVDRVKNLLETLRVRRGLSFTVEPEKAVDFLENEIINNYQNNKVEIDQLFNELKNSLHELGESQRQSMQESTDQLIEVLREGKDVSKAQEIWNEIKEGVKTGGAAASILSTIERFLGM